MAPKNKHVVVAIDFGTTFSGVAWAQASNPDALYLINQWPNHISRSHSETSSEKVPSEVAFVGHGPARKMIWGFQIPTRLPRLQWIKLGLDPAQKRGMTTLSFKYGDSRRASYPSASTPESVITDYLRLLAEHVAQIIKRQVGSAFESLTFTYVITVPAIWSEGAKHKTLTCAEDAGLAQSTPIHIVSEPEAAAIHTLKASNPHGLDTGDTVVPCDAGGGTVDLITFTIVELSPDLRLREAAPGTGGLCGSTFLNRRFEIFLSERLGSCPNLGEDTFEQATQHFELVAKRRFAGDASDDFAFPVPGIADDEALNVRRGCLHVTGTEVWDLFLPVLQEILGLVREQIKVSRTPVKSVFLVGGFGQNPFLQHFLDEALPSGIEVLAPIDGWTAVVRGALSKALSDVCSSAPQVAIETRVARKHYGQITSTKFEPSIHDDGRKWWCYFHGHWRISVMNWFIREGDDINESKPIVTSWLRQSRKSEGKVTSIKLTVYALDASAGQEAPLYFNREMQMHANLHPQLDSDLRRRIPVIKGKDNEEYYEVSYKIHASYYSAHCEYSLWFEGKKHGTVKVDYI